jgi:hypothetical protein
LAATLSGLKKILKEKSTSGFLNWRGMDRVKRFNCMIDLFSIEGIETENDL